MSERQPLSPEQSKEVEELEAASREQNERLVENRERAVEKSVEKNADIARENIDKIVESQEKKDTHKELAASAEKAPKKTRVRNKKSLDAAFKTEMNDVRRDMSAPSRAFSKLIHSKAVEKPSEAIGSTLARPNALLAGSLTALLLSGGVYAWATYVGYPLSGFETIGAFIIGWLLGIIFDFTRIMITGKQ